MVDFVYRREFDAYGQPMTFSFKANNLMDEDYLEHQEFGGGEIIINQYDLGVSYEFGLSTRF